MTAWHAGMDDPALVVMLDKEGVERNQRLRQGERIPAARRPRSRSSSSARADLRTAALRRCGSSSDRRRPLAPGCLHKSALALAPRTLFVQLSLLYSLAFERPIGSTLSVCGDRPINRESRPHLRRASCSVRLDHRVRGQRLEFLRRLVAPVERTWGEEPIAVAPRISDSRGEQGGEDGALRDIHECSGGAERRPVTGCGWPCEEAARLEATAAAPGPGSPAQAIVGHVRQATRSRRRRSRRPR